MPPKSPGRYPPTTRQLETRVIAIETQLEDLDAEQDAVVESVATLAEETVTIETLQRRLRWLEGQLEPVLGKPSYKTPRAGESEIARRLRELADNRAKRRG